MNVKLATSVLGTLLFAITGSAAMAQGYGGGGGSSYGGPIFVEAGSTVFGDYLHGAANVIRSEGQFNLLTSQAAINNQQAYSAALDNSKKAVQVYFERRQMNDSYRAQSRPPKATMEQITRLAKVGAPSRLGDEQLEASTGAIRWPATLARDEFADVRADLQQLFLERQTGPSGLGTQSYTDIRTKTQAMQARLNGMVKQLSTEEFTVANKFIQSLGYEARFVAGGVQNLAAN